MFVRTHRMYMMTPRDQISQDLSYFSGPSTSGAAMKRGFIIRKFDFITRFYTLSSFLIVGFF